MGYKKYNQYNLKGRYGIGYTSKGEEFYFDLEDYDKIKDYCWYVENGCGRVVANIYFDHKNHQIKLHRLILDFPDLSFEIDHVNRNMKDNRKENLRTCTHKQNRRNNNIRKGNKSGFLGVAFDVSRNKWKAEIMVDYRGLFLGRYNDINDAIIARLNAERKYFGEFSPQRHLFEEYGI